MQRVERVNPNVSPIMDDIDRLYAFLSEKQNNELISPIYDASFSSLIDVFNAYGDYYWDVKYKNILYDSLDVLKTNNLVLAFSGGKDSIAAALRYKERGYNVFLYHMRHINPSFADEWKSAKESAELLGLPIFFDDIRFKGHHMYMEHPMKNMIIANGALSYGVREGIGTRIAFGNYTTSFLEDNVFDRCAGDCVDMWEAYNKIIRCIISDFSIEIVLDNMGDTLNILADSRELLNTSLSCLCRHSLRDYRRAWVKDKFGVELFQKRCGSCYKCCVEYIYMTDHDKLEFSEAYYKYCVEQLYKVSNAENIMVTSMYDLWDTFIFYPCTQSKMFEHLKNAILLKRSIKWQ